MIPVVLSREEIDSILLSSTRVELLLKGMSSLRLFNPTKKSYVPPEEAGGNGIRFLNMWKEQGAMIPMYRYLVHNPEPAIAFCRKPVLVSVPKPTRYLVYKVISSQMNQQDPKIREKDFYQAKLLYSRYRNDSFFVVDAENAKNLDRNWAVLYLKGIDELEESL